jgi:adenylate cyclase
VRITAQLIEGASDSHVWAERYDRDLNDIFALQDEISQSIVAALKLKLLPAEKKAIESRSTTNPEAYKIFLMARQYTVTGSERHEQLIERLCRRAVEIDPGYARAWALLAVTLSRINYRDDAIAGGQAAAQKAIALDPNLAEAHAALAQLLFAQGRPQEALAEHEIALSLDPQSYDANRLAGRTYLHLRRYDDAIRHLEKAASLMDSDYASAALTIQCYEGKGDIEGAKAAGRRAMARIEKLIAVEPDHGSAMGHGAGILAILGEVDRAKEWTQRALLLDPTNTNLRYNLACAMSKLRDADAAIDLLESIFQDPRQQIWNWASQDNDLDPIRDHPRFKELMTRAEARLST